MKLVPLTDFVPNLIVDIRYATANNFIGQVLYVGDDVVPKLDESVAERVRIADSILNHQALRLVVWDSYRPEQIQKILRSYDDDSVYVAEDSNHCKGRAIDVTLANNNAEYLDMGTDFDEFTPRAHADSTDITASQQANRLLLRKAMEQAGFTQWPYEWWHYDFVG
jgi:D-alanyl-D-alanine dipeptidase